MKWIAGTSLFLVVASGVWAQQDAPVVRIPGRTETGRPRPFPATPPAPTTIPLENVMPRAEVQHEPAASDPAAVASPVSVPTGTILAWAKSMTNTPALPPGWLECNGQVVEDEASPYYGQTMPDLNSTEGDGGRFLRGGPASGTVGGSLTHTHGGYRSQKYGPQRSPVGGPIPVEHLPPFYSVVWIMRVR